MAQRRIFLCEILIPLLKYLPPILGVFFPRITPISTWLNIYCSISTPLPTGTIKEGHLWHYKIATILKMDQFDLFNQIWVDFWWGVEIGAGVTDGMNEKIKLI